MDVEAGDSDRDAIRVFTGPLDIVGRVPGGGAFGASELIEHGKEPVETDGGTIEGSKIERTHWHILR